MSSQHQAEDIHQRETKMRQQCAGLLCEIDRLASGMEPSNIRQIYASCGFRFQGASENCTQTFLAETRSAIYTLQYDPFYEGGPTAIASVLEAVVNKLTDLRKSITEQFCIPPLPESMPNPHEFLEPTAVAA